MQALQEIKIDSFKLDLEKVSADLRGKVEAFVKEAKDAKNSKQSNKLSEKELFEIEKEIIEQY